MRIALGLIAALAGCASSVPPGTRFATSSATNGDFLVPVQSVQERRFAATIRQRYDFSCGSAALATLLHYHYGDNATEGKVFIGMWKDGDRAAIRRVGFSLLDMKRYLAARGIKADGFKVTLDQIAKTGVPGIALISTRNYKHFVVVKGVNASEVLVGDPSTGLHAVPREAFQKTWNGVYFVLNSELERGRASFNQPGQWVAFARAPVGSRFSDPVNLQALALTAPFYGDF
jgi:uncharacterized protein